MATNYTGVPTATQAPSGPPVPGGAPIAQIPADGDSENAASVTQQAKVNADWIAWLMRPRARASQWAEEIMIFRDAALKKRFGIDHLGFPHGQINAWQNNWSFNLDNAPIGGAGQLTSATTESGWRFSGLKTNGSSEALTHIPDSSFIGSRYCQLNAGNTSGDYGYAEMVREPCLFNANNLIAMSWDARVAAFSNYRYHMGWRPSQQFVADGHDAQALFTSTGGAGNWICRTDDGTASQTADSGVAVDTNTHRFRVEYHGSVLDDAGAERCLFFIDGSLVANITAHLPSADPSPFPAPFFGLINSGGSGGQLAVGLISHRNTMWTDAFI